MASSRGGASGREAYERPQTQANQRAVGRGPRQEARLLLVAADRKSRRGV